MQILEYANTLFAIAVIGVVIVIAAIFAVDRQVENLKSRELEWRRLSSFRHDIKNHLLCLNNLLENEKKQQAASYMLNLTDTVTQFVC